MVEQEKMEYIQKQQQKIKDLKEQLIERKEGKKDSQVVMQEIEQRLIDANQILIDINGKIKEVFVEENLAM